MTANTGHAPEDRWPPAAREALSLPLDRLALRWLRHLVATKDLNADSTVHRGNETNPSMWASRGSEYQDRQFLRVMAEAWDWLALHGLVSVNPSEASGWGFITRKGLTMAGDPAAGARLRAEERLDVDLHPRLEHRVRSQFLLGELEAAAFLAMREVEIRVRELAGADASQIGVALVQTAFGTKGPLRDPSLEKGEQEATMALFWGAIGVFKNPSSHRPVDYTDPTLAAEVVLLADLLLRMLDRARNA